MNADEVRSSPIGPAPLPLAYEKGAHMKKIFLLLLVVAIGLLVAKQLSHHE